MQIYKLGRSQLKKKNYLIFLIGLIYLLFCPKIIATETANLLQTSELFVDLTHPKILYAKNDLLRLIPASVTKLFIAASALQQWGSVHTFATQIYQRGDYQDGVLQGDLVFYGLGDPELTNEKIWALVNNLQKLGLKKITGRLVVNTSYFGKVILGEPDRVQAKFHSKVAYDGLPSSIGTDFGNIAVFISPGSQVGDPAIVKILPYPLKNVLLKGKVLTSFGQNNSIRLNRVSKDKKEILTIAGNLGIKSNPVTIYRSVGDPNLTTAALVVAFLKQAGISLSGKVSIESMPLQPTDKLIAQSQSYLLIRSLQDMLFYSNNYIADMLMLDLWKENQVKASSFVQLSDAAKLLLNTYKPMLAETDFTSSELNGFPSFKNASGLTPYNRISARDLIILLEGMYKNKRDFPIFYGSLMIPGQQKFWRGIPTVQHSWMVNTSIKTGHISMPKAVYTMAGYFRMKNGDLGAFAVLFNAPPAEDENGKLFKKMINHMDNLFSAYH